MVEASVKVFVWVGKWLEFTQIGVVEKAISYQGIFPNKRGKVSRGGERGKGINTE